MRLEGRWDVADPKDADVTIGGKSFLAELLRVSRMGERVRVEIQPLGSPEQPRHQYTSRRDTHKYGDW
jgi:hypothetical protein